MRNDWCRNHLWEFCFPQTGIYLDGCLPTATPSVFSLRHFIEQMKPNWLKNQGHCLDYTTQTFSRCSHITPWEQQQNPKVIPDEISVRSQRPFLIVNHSSLSLHLPRHWKRRNLPLMETTDILGMSKIISESKAEAKKQGKKSGKFRFLLCFMS